MYILYVRESCIIFKGSVAHSSQILTNFQSVFQKAADSAKAQLPVPRKWPKSQQLRVGLPPKSWRSTGWTVPAFPLASEATSLSSPKS